MNNWSVIFATVVIFGAGVLTGGFLVNRVEHPHWKNVHHQEISTGATNAISISPPAAAHPRLPDFMNRQFLQRLDGELHLAPDQREAIQKIIADGQNLMRKTMQDARLEIREQLTPEQRKQFDELVKRPPHRPAATNAPAVSFPTNLPPVALTNAA